MKYTVEISREGDAWLADIPSIEGANTYARSIDVLLRAIREVIVLMGDLPEGSEFEFDLAFDLGDELVAKAFEIGRARTELANREAELMQQTTNVIHELSQSGFTVRDTARLLEMTPGRVSQIANA